MSEGAAAVAVAQRPDAGHLGAQLFVDLDEPALVDGQTGLVEAEVVSVRETADSDKQMRAEYLIGPYG